MATCLRCGELFNDHCTTNNVELAGEIIIKVREHFAKLKPNSTTLSGCRQIRSWSQTCSEMKFGLSFSCLAAN